MALMSFVGKALRAQGLSPEKVFAPPPVVFVSPPLQVFNAWADGQFVRSMATFVADRLDTSFDDALKQVRAISGTPHIAASFPETWRRTALLLGVPAEAAAPTVH